MIRRVIAAGTAAAGLVLAGAVAPAVAATTAPAPVRVLSVTVSDVTLKPHHTVSVKVTAKLSRALVGDEEGVAIVGPADTQNLDELGYDVLAPTSVPTTLATTFTIADTVRPGSWVAEADIFGSPTAQTPSSSVDKTFHVKLPTALKVNASPEPAAYGETITVVGGLTHYSQSAKKSTAYAGKKVDVYFDPKGAAPRAKVGSVTTNSKGGFTKRFTARTTGTWSAQFAGTSSYAAARSVGDSVVVEKKKTHLAVNASPEPVKKGAKVTVAGRLTHATSVRGTLHYTAYHGKTLTVWFNPAGPKGASKVATVTTSSTGAFSTKRTQSAAGTWTVKFAGTAGYAASSGTDYVAVR